MMRSRGFDEAVLTTVPVLWKEHGRRRRPSGIHHGRTAWRSCIPIDSLSAGGSVRLVHFMSRLRSLNRWESIRDADVGIF